MTSKITKATFKSFLNKNQENLMILCKSSFDGMVDGVVSTGDKTFVKATGTFNKDQSHTLGFSGVWLVGGSRDYFTAFETDTHKGIEVYNSCGRFIVAIEK